MEKKIVLVTGASDGIGKETDMQLAKRGYHVIMHGRDRAKTVEAHQWVRRESGNNDVKVTFLRLRHLLLPNLIMHAFSIYS